MLFPQPERELYDAPGWMLTEATGVAPSSIGSSARRSTLAGAKSPGVERT